MGSTLAEEFERIQQMFVGFSVSIPALVIDRTRLERFEASVARNHTLDSVCRELLAKLKSIRSPDSYVQLAQAYEVYAEACFCFRLATNELALARTPGTGEYKAKRPDFRYSQGPAFLYFEVKALEIADPVIRNPKIGMEALDVMADLDARVRSSTGQKFFSSELAISGHQMGSTAAQRIDETIQRICNVVKPEQLELGPTVLVVDLGRLWPKSQGRNAILPVFHEEGHSAEACASGELWHIACGHSGERIFVSPEFEGGSNLGGHQKHEGVLHQLGGLVAITFVLHAWDANLQMLTIWNPGSTGFQSGDHPSLSESEIEEILWKYSDAFNNTSSECPGPGPQQTF